MDYSASAYVINLPFITATPTAFYNRKLSVNCYHHHNPNCVVVKAQSRSNRRLSHGYNIRQRRRILFTEQDLGLLGRHTLRTSSPIPSVRCYHHRHRNHQDIIIHIWPDKLVPL